ncbi:MAG: hypothetical protein CBD69_010340 [Crocinitomicaceae bacterium TMED209]|nr:MAG: hypothetical protein CBD69_010340 [Crocinitomicaceae bacterium TMED209]
MGLLRLIATAALVWFVFRWLDRLFGGRQNASRSQADTTRRGPRGGSQHRTSQPKDDGLGDYVDFEEVDEP